MLRNVCTKTGKHMRFYNLFERCRIQTHADKLSHRSLYGNKYSAKIWKNPDRHEGDVIHDTQNVKLYNEKNHGINNPFMNTYLIFNQSPCNLLTPGGLCINRCAFQCSLIATTAIRTALLAPTFSSSQCGTGYWYLEVWSTLEAGYHAQLPSNPLW